MKKVDLEQLLIAAGYRIVRHGRHNIWRNRHVTVCVPHHREVNIFLSKEIIKTIARNHLSLGA